MISGKLDLYGSLEQQYRKMKILPKKIFIYAVIDKDKNTR